VLELQELGCTQIEDELSPYNPESQLKAGTHVCVDGLPYGFETEQEAGKTQRLVDKSP